MNNAGQIIATARVPTFRAVLYEDGVWTNLGTLPGDGSSGATAINGTGQVVGYSSRHGGQRSFLWHRDTGMVDLALPVASSSATAISETGEIAGSFTIGNSGDQHPYVYRDGSMMDLGTLPGDPGAEAAGVNSLGQVVGTSGSGDPFRPRHAFLWQEDLGLVDLNDLIPRGVGWELQHATAINDAGQIVGYGRIVGQTHAFRLDPVVPIKTHRR